MRAFAVGLAYFLVVDLPGLTSSFVAIFIALLPFDLIVAMPKFSFKLKHWRDLIVIILPRISGTAVTLGKGLLIGSFFGGLEQLGLPLFVGALLTVGLSYQVAVRTRGNVSSYVGMLAGLTVFEEITNLSALSPTLLADMSGVILQMIYVTFLALFSGWLVGIVVGVVTRLFLPRGYRSLLSSAYELPLSMQPFKDVLHADDNVSLVKVQVEEASSLAYRSLAETQLRTRFHTSILSINRQGSDIVAPDGYDTLRPGDVVVMIAPTEQLAEVLVLIKGSEASEQV